MLIPSRTGKLHLTLGSLPAPVSPTAPVKVMLALGDADGADDDVRGRVLGVVVSVVAHPARRRTRLTATKAPAATTTMPFRFSTATSDVTHDYPAGGRRVPTP